MSDPIIIPLYDGEPEDEDEKIRISADDIYFDIRVFVFRKGDWWNTQQWITGKAKHLPTLATALVKAMEIKDDNQHQLALLEVDKLMDAEPGSKEDGLLNVYVAMIEEYENKTCATIMAAPNA